MPAASIEAYVSRKVGEAVTILRSEMPTKAIPVSDEEDN